MKMMAGSNNIRVFDIIIPPEGLLTIFYLKAKYIIYILRENRSKKGKWLVILAALGKFVSNRPQPLHCRSFTKYITLNVPDMTFLVQNFYMRWVRNWGYMGVSKVLWFWKHLKNGDSYAFHIFGSFMALFYHREYRPIVYNLIPTVYSSFKNQYAAISTDCDTYH